MKKRALCLALCVLLCAIVVTPALAYTRIDTGAETSLTLSITDGGEGLAGARFKLYRVADVSETVRFTLSGDFAGYPVTLEDLDAAGWKALAETLSAYASRDRLTPLRTGETSADGTVSFGALATGLYLVTGDRFAYGSYIYTPEPFLICLPNLDAEDNWLYDAGAAVKYEKEYVPEPGTTVSRRVLKVWDDAGFEAERPGSIEVELLKNGEVFDRVSLNSENNWSHTWEGLDADALWQVAETAPEGYTVKVTQEGTAFVITNTRTPTDEPTPPPTDDPGVPPTPPSDIPQTGQLWWPVPALAALGLVLVIIGLLRRRSGNAQ